LISKYVSRKPEGTSDYRPLTAEQVERELDRADR
jgi:hypothetical protein